jgi:hypothetical protein
VVVTVAGTVLGLVLFVLAVDRVGMDAIVVAVRRVGWGLLVILALGGARFAIRAQCWRWCLLPGVALDFRHAFSAYLAGDAVGNVTPLGLIASEPTKVVLTRHHLATFDSVVSLALENLLYTVSVLAMLALGLFLLLATVAVPGPLRASVIAGLVLIAVAAAGALAMLRAPANGRAPGPRFGARFLRMRGELARFAADHPARMARVFSLQLLFHALAILETYLTLEWLIADHRPTVAQAILFETVNRLTVVLFKFVPFRIGVDEATSGAAAPLLAATAAAGVALAVIRKTRMLFWSSIGLLLVATHPAGPPERDTRDR